MPNFRPFLLLLISSLLAGCGHREIGRHALLAAGFRLGVEEQLCGASAASLASANSAWRAAANGRAAAGAWLAQGQLAGKRFATHYAQQPPAIHDIGALCADARLALHPPSVPS